ncbi:hypothetical protein V1522DRAFT_391663 [Lipomyces starkeyi]
MLNLDGRRAWEQSLKRDNSGVTISPVFVRRRQPKSTSQPDFRSQHSRLAIAVRSRGHRIPRILSEIPVQRVSHFARMAWRYIHAYTPDLDGKAATFAVKNNKSHRRLPERFEIVSLKTKWVAIIHSRYMKQAQRKRAHVTDDNDAMAEEEDGDERDADFEVMWADALSLI